jgi:osmotically-inducible protein OsmY
MNLTAWNVGPVLALMTLTAAPACTQATQASQTAAEKAKEDAARMKEAVVNGATITAEKTKDGLSKTGEVMTDAWITTRVHARFVGEDLFKDSDISVATRKHVVTLKGTVMEPAARVRASSIAKHTEGVRRVVNRLTIGPKHRR